MQNSDQVTTNDKMKKKNFTSCQLQQLLTTVEARKAFLFDPFYRCVTNNRKPTEWEGVCEAVNAAGSETRTPQAIKKKWSDRKMHVKRRTAAQAGGGRGEVIHAI